MSRSRKEYYKYIPFMLDRIFLIDFNDMSKYTLTKIYYNTSTQTNTSSLPHGHSTSISMFKQMWIQNSTQVCAPCCKAQKGLCHIS